MVTSRSFLAVRPKGPLGAVHLAARATVPAGIAVTGGPAKLMRGCHVVAAVWDCATVRMVCPVCDEGFQGRSRKEA